MRELTVVTLIAFASVALGSISSSCSENAIEPGVKHLARTLSLNPKQVTRSLRQYDFRDVVEPEGERGIGGISEKADDILRKAEGLIGKGQLSSTLNGAVSKALMVADDAATISRSMEKYPKGLSTATMKQIRIVEEMRLNDIATWTKETGSGMRRKIEPFEGIKIAPKKYLEAHVGKDLKRYGEDGSRLVSAAVVSRSAKEGGGDVLLISNSKPSNRDFLLPKGGWEKHEGIEHAALREVIEEGGVRAKLLHELGEFKNGNTHTYYAYRMQAGTVYDDWAESVRYRLWVSYDDAIKLLVNRPKMIEIVKKAQEIDTLIKAGKLKDADPKLAKYVLESFYVLSVCKPQRQ